LSTTIIQVDAFTNRPFAGNPAAVCVLDASASDGWMQRVASEMNLSETAFLHPIDGGPRYRLRWFTPTVEVDLCGHATLAAAHVLWDEGLLEAGETAEFETRSGLLTARLRDGWIALDFPAEPIETVVSDPRDLEKIAQAVGGPIVFAGRNRFDLLAELADEAAVVALRPDFGKVKAIHARGVIATSRSADPAFDFVSRFFAPRVGVDEDPVCGSAHSTLVPYWADRLGKMAMRARQVSARTGELRVELRGDRVLIGGHVVEVIQGTLTIP
jgi:PhzF family phenazine biosynthesis protein